MLHPLLQLWTRLEWLEDSSRCLEPALVALRRALALRAHSKLVRGQSVIKAKTLAVLILWASTADYYYYIFILS